MRAAQIPDQTSALDCLLNTDFSRIARRRPTSVWGLAWPRLPRLHLLLAGNDISRLRLIGIATCLLFLLAGQGCDSNTGRPAEAPPKLGDSLLRRGIGGEPASL